MAEKTTSSNAEFQLVQDPLESRKLLSAAAKETASTMIWTKNQEQVINTRINLYSDHARILYAWVPPGFDPNTLLDTLNRTGENECYFSVSLMKANIFFRCPYLKYDSGGLQFKAPNKIYKVQRRKDVRFTIPELYAYKIEFPDPLLPENQLIKKMIDISAGGLSFLVDDQDAPLFQVGVTLRNMTFKLNGRVIVVDGEVRHNRPHRVGSRVLGTKVGIQFKSIRPGEAQHIATFVFEETRKMLSRLL